MKIIFFIFLIGLLLCFPVAALLPGDITIIPNESVMRGDPVSASFNLTLSPFDRYSTNPDNSIILSTSLDNAEWTRSSSIESIPGQDIPFEGNTVAFEGWQLAYPLGTPEIINLTLSGIAPNVSASQAESVFQVSEFANGTQIPGTQSTFSILVINPTDISYIVSKEQADLQELHSELLAQGYEPNISGGENTAAETLYDQASNGILYLQTLKPAEYPQAVNRAREVDQAIQNAKDMLKREVIQEKISKAITPINRTAIILGWFSAHAQNYRGLSNVSSQYQQSLSLLSKSSENMNNKKWITASDSADRAYILGNQTLYAAIALQKRASDPLTPLWDNLLIIISVIVMVILYFSLFRKKKSKKQKEKSL
jgi:hypothetical protein